MSVFLKEDSSGPPNTTKVSNPIIILDESTTFEMDSNQKLLHDLCRGYRSSELKSGGSRKLLAEGIRLQRIVIFCDND